MKQDEDTTLLQEVTKDQREHSSQNVTSHYVMQSTHQSPNQLNIDTIIKETKHDIAFNAIN